MKNKGLLSIGLLSMLFAAFAFNTSVNETINVNAENYSIKFKTSENDTSNTISQGTKVSDVVSSGNDYISGFTSLSSKAYYGCKNGVKLGSSSATGALGINIASEYKNSIASLTIKSAKYGSDTGTLSISASNTLIGSNITPGNDFTYTFSELTTVDSLLISTSSKRAYISEIILSTSVGGDTLDSISVSGVYKTEFKLNDTFDHDGLKVIATYGNETTKEVTSKVTIDTPDMTTIGTKTVNISYTENNITRKTSYDIEVKENVDTNHFHLQGLMDNNTIFYNDIGSIDLVFNNPLEESLYTYIYAQFNETDSIVLDENDGLHYSYLTDDISSSSEVVDLVIYAYSNDYMSYFEEHHEITIIKPNSLVEAIEFVSAFTPVCDNGLTPPSRIDWSDASEYFDLLNDDEKQYLYNGEYNYDGETVTSKVGTHNEIANFLAKYDYIVSKYGKANYSDYLSRNPQKLLNGNLLIDNSNNNSLILISVILSLSSICLISVIYIKNRRHA